MFEITEKVSFNNASEASYAYIFSGQKLIKNAKIPQFWPKPSGFQNQKIVKTIFGILNELLSTSMLHETFSVIFKHCVGDKIFFCVKLSYLITYCILV